MRRAPAMIAPPAPQRSAAELCALYAEQRRMLPASSFDVDKHPYDPSAFVEYDVKAQTPEEIAAVRSKYPFLTEREASQILLMRHLMACSSLYGDSQGGGRAPDYFRNLERKYGQKNHSIF